MDKQIQQKIETFFSQYKAHTMRKGEILIRADEEPTGIYYLTSGSVRMYSISAKGDEIVVNLFKPISFFPMSWAMNDTKNSYYYEAMTDVTLTKAPKDAVITFLKENSDVLYDLLSRVYRGLDGVITRMAFLMAGSAHARLINELLISARRFGKAGELHQIIVSISEKDLASQAGLTRETVSREIKVLKEKGLVSLNKNEMVISDIVKLEDELFSY